MGFFEDDPLGLMGEENKKKELLDDPFGLMVESEVRPEEPPVEVSPPVELTRKPEPVSSIDVKQPTEEEIEEYRNSTWLKEFFKGAGRDIKHVPAVVAGSTAEGFMGSLAGKMGKGMATEGFVYSDDPQKDILEAYDRHQKVQALKKQGKTTTEASHAVDRPDKDPFGIQPHREEMNPYLSAITTGAGHLIGELPSMMFVLGNVDKVGKLYNWAPKITQVAGMAIHGVINGLSDGDIKAAAQQGVTGGIMGSIGGIVSKIKPKVLQMMAEGLGFASVGQLSKAIETGEIPDVMETLLDPQTFADFGLGAIMAAKRLRGETVTSERISIIEKAKEQHESIKKVVDDFVKDINISEFENKVQSSRVQKEIKNIVGEKEYGSKSKLADAAIQLYIDLPNYKGNIPELIKNLKGFDKQALIRATEITEADPLYNVAKLYRLEYEKIGANLVDMNVIDGLKENYANRIWDLGEGKGGSGGKFQTSTSHAKKRILDSILNGLEDGKELKVKTATENLHIYKNEMARVLASNKLIEAGLHTELLPGKTIFSKDWMPGYEKIENPWFKKNLIIEKENKFGGVDRTILNKSIHAPKQLAKEINNILGKEGKQFSNLAKFVATAKAVTLTTSLFHHQAFLRSFVFGVSGKQALRPFKGYKEGLKAIEGMHPDIRLLVENGLTLGVQQEYPEMMRSKTGSMRDKATDVVSKIPVVRILGPKFLFEKFGAGLKAKAAMVEMEYMRKRNAKRIKQGKDPIPEAQMAEEVAGLINNDFGGLNLDRLGRNKSLQKAFRIFTLAPDWTESNIRTMTKMIRLKNGQERRGQWTSASETEAHLYRKFWFNVASRGMAISAIGNVLMSLIGDDNDTKKMRADAIKSGKLKNMLGVDITPLVKMLGYKGGRKMYFSVLGHFLDPAKWIEGAVKYDVLQMPKHKGSHLTRALLSSVTGSDWKSYKYKTVKEIMEDGVSKGYVKWGKNGVLTGGQIPTFLFDQAKGMMPIQAQQLMRYLTEESDGIEAIMKSMGFDTSKGVDIDGDDPLSLMQD